MNILDIDADFFLSEITRLPSDSSAKRQGDKIVPWSESEVRRFLEQKCGLSTRARTPGNIVTRHDQVFWCWRDLIAQGRLEVPFNLVHVDAHADMGLGDASWVYICTEVLGLPPDERTRVKADAINGVNEDSYLAFAIACRWIQSLTYVHHPNLNLQLGDIPPVHMRDLDVMSGAIQLKWYSLDDLQCVSFDTRRASPIALEPEVPLRRVVGTAYQAQTEFDFAFFSHSPRYTPASVDFMLGVASEYIDSRPVG
ncbi:MAG: UPF0489 family protein [Candidatus Lambdaproteobacteria bacterium]|nr:UPF0489 family protein [Candidatus Lambdaproteobacteria bacterium]